ncbi:hypothetical protein [Candidatus Finniella inopinata]|uniref:Cell envelope integrity protein TolA n=1 Tax=Candidatus Finniella inopinata TaxID=1696036 RepID=A0A4Q7DQ28_9PROT|nr:hypothetical protein [Candidatus Finniella inopinata]RZI47146.1 hypothetical protein EQU50_00765 [Candidatus Finniella inopinata]
MMRNFVIASLILHAAVVLLFCIGIGNPFQKTLKDQQPLLIDFVNIAEKSAAPKLSPQQKIEPVKPKPQPEPEVKPEPKPEPEPVSKPQEAEKPKPQEQKPPEPEKVEEPVKPESIPVKKKEPPKKKEEKKPDPKKSDSKKTENPKPKEIKNHKAEVNLKKDKVVSKPDKDKKTDPKAKKQLKASLDDLLKDVDKDSDESQGDDGAPAETIGDTVTASEIDALRQHMRKCWVVPAGIKGAKDMAVDIKMELSKDGTVIKADIVDKSRMARDSAFRTAAESAKRAALDPQCSPLPLPPGKYDQWKNLEFSFNPKDMY